MGRLLNSKTSHSVRFVGPAESGEISTQLISDPEFSTWGEATQQFISRIESYEAAEDTTEVELHPVFDTHIYTEAWAKAVWSELYSHDESALQWATSTALITFSGSYWLDKDSRTFCPPLTFLRHLQQSKQARQKALSRVLDSVDRWAALRAIGGEGHNGYPRVYLGLYLSEPIDADRFAPVLDSHVQNCSIANSDAHTVTNAVSVERGISDDNPVELVHGIGQKVPSLSECGIIYETEDRQRMAAALHALDRDPYILSHSLM